ncbi:CBY1-interacting BAR domain-containing protein 1-B [Leptopilina boulardi]|uniref:CBY1-interacting BAR domain-containing protein 1-B n=1 Tax=Leptopilina boulardi TaxID=63433 RepID=UPI0021F6479F|nr:CBY1-interacting BAR domain-containing protein 1-B [Leptopilina boulardi]
MLRTRSQTNICEQEAKFVQERISTTEKNFSELHTAFAAYTRKLARLRDKNDEVAEVINTYAKSESINRSLSICLNNFSSTFAVISDYRDAAVKRVDAKVVSPLFQYSTSCKHAREDVKNTFSVQEKEFNRRRQLDKIRERNPKNRQLISQAETELIKASMEMTRVVKGLEEQIDSFEKQKLHDVKSILLDFITIELCFHTKAVELLTKGFQDISDIDEVKDLQEFREVMQIPNFMTRIDAIKRKSFRQANSLSNLTNRFLFLGTQKKTTTWTDSLKANTTHSSESAQIEDYEETSVDTESEFEQTIPVRVRHKTV